MNSISWWRIIRAAAVLSLLFAEPVFANFYVPLEAEYWQPAELVELATPAILALDPSLALFNAMMSFEPNVSGLTITGENLPEGILNLDLLAVWVLEHGILETLGKPKGDPQSSSDVAEPAAFLLTGAGLILLVKTTRPKRRRSGQGQ